MAHFVGPVSRKNHSYLLPDTLMQDPELEWEHLLT